ncbi:hypothetical protein ACFQE8_10335 [Salinirubellus sp. GCM10025818]|uniref:hypothetical protein n=1 Tax=Salinirubellus TaxID=2162630 RepID=UPI0030D0561E
MGCGVLDAGSRYGGDCLMDLVMCLSCGEFVPARSNAGVYEPRRVPCPDCEGMSFKHIESGQVTDVG